MVEDPFFSLGKNTNWNAFIGNQSEEIFYMEGYIEAAYELACLVIEKELYSQRDTLIMPILYNARHSIELHLKFVVKHLHEFGVISSTHPMNHDIASHLSFLIDEQIGDRALRELLVKIEPYVLSLSAIDSDGQELRFAENRQSEISLEGLYCANILHIRESLKSLKELLLEILQRVMIWADEIATGSFTKKLSRQDLLEIADLIPDKEKWEMPIFNQAKKEVKDLFGLSNREFSTGIDVIKHNRTMKTKIGLQTDLLYLSDENAVFLMTKWLEFMKECEKHRNQNESQITSDLFQTIEILKPLETEFIQHIFDTLSREEVIDAQIVYYIHRDGYYCEGYEKLFQTINNDRQNIPTKNLVSDLLNNMQFGRVFPKGVRLLGRVSLADSLDKLLNERTLS